MLRRLTPFAALVLVLADCKPNGLIVPYDCDHPCTTCSDPCGECKNGECVELPPLVFEGPVLLAVGPEGLLPECPVAAPFVVYEGLAPGQMVDCPTCTCAAPACELPSELWGDVTTCPGAMALPFDVPAPWDGSCVAPAMTPPGPLLSVTLGPFGPGACAPGAGEPVPFDGTPVRVQVKACQGVTVDPNPCTDMGMLCAAVDPGSGGFRQCIFQPGEDIDCPEPYNEAHVFHQAFQDTRDCSPCACGPAEGSACAVDVTLYADDACAGAMNMITVHADDPENCIAGAQSVVAEVSPGSEPGSCQASGGEPMGGIEDATAPATFCCRPL